MDKVELPYEDLRRLLAAANGDAVLLYVYLATGHEAASACQDLRMNASRYELAAAALRQLGLWKETTQRHLVSEEAPSYTEADVVREMTSSPEFSAMIGEVQRRLGRVLSTEEIKILLSIFRYLGLPADVIAVLVNFCIQRAQARGLSRMPSLRAIEKEAYYWADFGIDTMGEAAVYMQTQLQKQDGMARMKAALGITDRNLSLSEEKFVNLWVSWGFGEDAVRMAYDRTCLNAGSLKWNYLHAILKSWHEKGLHTPAEIEAGDMKPSGQGRGREAQKVIRHDDALTPMELSAIDDMMKKGLYHE